MEDADGAELWAAAHAYAATYPPVVMIDGGVQGHLRSIGIELPDAASGVEINATYVSLLGALKTHRVLVSAEQLIREHRADFSRDGEGGPYTSELLFAQYDTVECTFSWEVPEDETLVDGPDWRSELGPRAG